MGAELKRRMDAALGVVVKCTVCGRTADEPHDFQHAFTTTPNDLRDKPAPEPPRRTTPSVITTDIVLRLALVNKGVLTTDDLRAAEVQLGIGPGMAVVGQPEAAPPGSHDGN